MLVHTFLECSLHLVGCAPNPAKIEELAQVMSTLELLPANMAVALIFLYKFRLNSVIHIDTTCGLSMPYYSIVAALVVANKFLHDQSYTLKTWHSMLTKFLLLNAPLSVLNQLEVHLLAALDYLVNTKHDAAMWSEFAQADAYHVAQLRLAVDPAPYPDVMTGLATPPLPRQNTPTYLTYLSYASTPVMAGPITPASQPLVAFTPVSQTMVTPWTTHHVEVGCKRRRLGMGQKWLYVT